MQVALSGNLLALVKDGTSFPKELHLGAALGKVRHRKQVTIELQHVENILQNHGRRGTFGMHVNRDVTDTCGLNGTVVAKNDVGGGIEMRILLEPVPMRTHVAGSTGVDDPVVLQVRRGNLSLSLEEVLACDVWTFGGG